MHLLNLWNAPFELINASFESFISICNAPFELYNANNLNENKIVTTFKSVNKLIGELNVNWWIKHLRAKIGCRHVEKSYKIIN